MSLIRPEFMYAWRTQLRAHSTYRLRLDAGIALECPEGTRVLGAPAMLTFSTGADTVAPSVLARDVSTGVDSVEIRYAFSEPAGIDLVLTGPDGGTHHASAPSPALEGTVQVDGLDPGTTYRVDEHIVDEAANSTVLADTFTTDPNPTTTTTAPSATTTTSPDSTPTTVTSGPSTTSTTIADRWDGGDTPGGDGPGGDGPGEDRVDPDAPPQTTPVLPGDGLREEAERLDTPPPGTVAVAVSAPAVSAGEDLTLEAVGFAPDSEVTLTLHSRPRRLATVVADAEGRLRMTVAIPADVEEGAHQILVEGVGPDGTRLVAAAALDVLPAATGAALSTPAPAEGSARGVLVLLIGGLILVVVALRCRRRPTLPEDLDPS